MSNPIPDGDDLADRIAQLQVGVAERAAETLVTVLEAFGPGNQHELGISLDRQIRPTVA